MGRRVYKKKMSIVAAKLTEDGSVYGCPTPLIYRYSEDLSEIDRHDLARDARRNMRLY